MKVGPVILVLLVFFLCPVFLNAESKRCEWAECPEAIKTPQTPVIKLEICTEADRGSCREQCRLEFGDAFHVCVNACLGKSCHLNPEASSDSVDREAGAWCVEFESKACDEECASESGSAKLRCRRTCLEGRCPEANRSETTQESISPGSAECNRCRQRHERDCRRLCGSGSVYVEKSSGLAQFGCEKACLVGRCGTSCAVGW